MNRKDILIEKQQEQIDEITEVAQSLLSQNVALTNALVETERRLSKIEEKYDEDQLRFDEFEQ